MTPLASKLRLKIIYILLAIMMVALLGMGIWKGPRFVKIQFFLDRTITIPEGCLDIDTMVWGDYHESKRVCIKSFEMDKYEETWKVFAKHSGGKILEALGYTDSSGKNFLIAGSEDLPRTGLPWNDADSFCRVRGMRLPTSDEWEYAARAGNSQFHLGDEDLGNVNLLGVLGKDNYFGPSPVGSFKANKFGLYDMIGNVEEWTSTCRGEDHEIIPVDSVRRADWKEYIECAAGGNAWDTRRHRVGQGLQNHSKRRSAQSLGVRCVK